MAEYILPIVIISAVTGMLSFISYPEAGDKASKFAASVLIIYVSLMPMLSFIGDISKVDIEGFFEEIKTEENVGDPEYIKVTEEAFKEGICKLLVTKYGIKRENIKIYVFNFDFEAMRAESVKIILSGRAAAADARGMESYLNTLALGDFEVNIEL